MRQRKSGCHGMLRLAATAALLGSLHFAAAAQTWSGAQAPALWIDEKEIPTALLGRDFDRLEFLAADARTGTRFPEAGWTLDAFYKYIASRDIEPALGMERIQEWMRAKPDSVAARIALAGAYVKAAWAARGNGLAKTVTPEGWRGFRHNLALAEKTLQEAEALQQKDPHLYAVWLTVAQGMGYPRPARDELFDKGYRILPGYAPLVGRMANGLQPKWGGPPGALERFAQVAANGAPDGMADETYVLAADTLPRSAPEWGFDYDRIRRGLADARRRFPSSNWLLNKECAYAVAYDDRATAHRLFQEIGDRWHGPVWWSEDYFRKAKAWAAGIGPHPSVAGPIGSGSSIANRLSGILRPRNLVLIVAISSLAILLRIARRRN